jgi:hypothetical protein
MKDLKDIIDNFQEKICRIIDIIQDKPILTNNSIDIGYCSWILIHACAYNYPNSPTDIQKKAVTALFEKIILSYESDLKDEINTYLQEIPINANSRNELIKWTCDFHNFINVKINKPLFDINKYVLRWKKY